MKEKRFLLAIAALSLLATSCAEDINIFGKNDKSFQFKVTTDNGPAVKSGSDVWAIAEDSELEVGDMKLTLSATASYNRMDPFASINTKGTVLNNDNLAKVLQEFNLYIPMADIMNVTVAADDEGKWSIQPEGGVPVWPEEYHDKIDMPFIAYTGGELDRNDNKKFTYTSPVDESDQIDLLYAYTEANKNDVAIHFYHALSAVRFIVGDLGENLEVTSVKINNVAVSGAATYVEGADGTVDFTWDTSKSSTEVFASEEATCTFFVIPQLVDDISFEIGIKDNIGNVYTVEHNVPKLEGGWKSGYFYTYRINGGEGEVSIDIDEKFENNAKSEVKGVNDGQLTSYVRAAVVANWCNSVGKVVAPWDGELTSGTKWSKIGDFYYYSEPVAAEGSTEDLFNESISGNGAPSGTHLEVHILMQAVEYDPENAKVLEAWPEFQNKQ